MSPEFAGEHDTMTVAEFPSPVTDQQPTRKPRLAIMGEFSAGKSTLTNLLIGSDPLPVKITATQLPPVWISYGEADPYREDMDGAHHPIDLHDLNSIPLDDTAVIRIFLKSEILELCDLIDMPGISDPNMDSAVWERVLPVADGVLWCTHATQAWRQSEAAVWKTVPQILYSKSFLLLTRFDKLLNQKDRDRVVRRVVHETDNLFAGIYPISLTDALASDDDRQQWVLSGAEEFAEDLLSLIGDLAVSLQPEQAIRRDLVANSRSKDSQENVLKLETGGAGPAENVDEAGRVMPSRVRVPTKATGRTRRPTRSEVPPNLNEAVARAGQASGPESQP